MSVQAPIRAGIRPFASPPGDDQPHDVRRLSGLTTAGFPRAGLLVLAMALASAASAEPYQDRYLEADDIRRAPARAEVPQPSGPPTDTRLVSRTYIDRRDNGQDRDEHAIELSADISTLRFGSFAIDLEQRYAAADPNLDDRGRRVRIRQASFPLTRTLSLSSEAGHLRTRTPSAIATGYRVSLPSSIMRGASSSLTGKRGSLTVTAGELGNFDGVVSRGFEAADATTYGIGGDYSPSERWTLAGQYWRAEDLPGGPDGRTENSFAFAGIYATARERLQLRTLVDGDLNAGVFADGLVRRGALTHRFGLFHAERALRWTAAPIDNDRQGVYWRSDFRSPRWRFDATAEVNRRGLGSDPSGGRRTTAQTFANLGWKASRRLEIGGSVAVSNTHVQGQRSDQRYQLRGFADRRGRGGRTRIELLARRREVDSREPEFELRIDQDWLRSRRLRLATRAEANWLSNRREQLIGSLAEFSFAIDWRANLQTQLIRTSPRGDANGGGTSHAVYATAGVSWNPPRRWFAELTATLNRVDSGSPATPRQRQGAVLFTLGMNTSRGRAPTVFGFDRGEQGVGQVEGYLFVDADRDGLRDPDEAPLDGITVFLDGRYRTITDRDGRFVFDPVPSGQHDISVADWQAPLPLTLGENERHVIVEVRSVTTVDYGFVELEQ